MRKTLDKIRENCKKCFETHKAEVVQDTDRYLIIDWRREDGSGEYYINYIVDKERGGLIVSGDLGESIALWYNPIKPSNLKNYVRDVEYYIGKLTCCTDKYVFDVDNIIYDIKENMKDFNIEDFVGEGKEFEDDEEFWDYISEEVENSLQIRDDDFIPSNDLTRIIEKIDPDYYFEWLYECGRSIHIRVYLWSEGFYMACNQLGI